MLCERNVRMLLVHAHPDDETIGNGATMAKYVSEGVQVTLVTCTVSPAFEFDGFELAPEGWEPGA